MREIRSSGPHSLEILETNCAVN